MESSDHEQTQAAGGPCTHVTIIISGQSVRVEVVKFQFFNFYLMHTFQVGIKQAPANLW